MQPLSIEECRYNNYPWRLDDLKKLCQKYLYDIATPDDPEVLAFQEAWLSDICVRYIVKDDMFGYAKYGDFFFYNDCMYVITDDDSMKEHHNEEGASLFETEYGERLIRSEKYICRVIFAGIRTPYKDELGDWVYTGDLVHAKFLPYNMIEHFARGNRRATPTTEYKRLYPQVKRHKTQGVIACVEAWPIAIHNAEKGEPPVYVLVLDNHFVRLSQSTRIDRIGTVFWGLKEDATEVPILSRSQHTFGYTRNDYIRAKYTPNFGPSWHGLALNTLGVEEYNWRR